MLFQVEVEDTVLVKGLTVEQALQRYNGIVYGLCLAGAHVKEIGEGIAEVHSDFVTEHTGKETIYVRYNPEPECEPEPRKIRLIAAEIYQTWAKVNYAAKPYLEAMMYLDTIDDTYGWETGASVIGYFLSNARAYKGEDARRIKAELKQLLKG